MLAKARFDLLQEWFTRSNPWKQEVLHEMHRFRSIIQIRPMEVKIPHKRMTLDLRHSLD
jgi:hypothetical protein